MIHEIGETARRAKRCGSARWLSAVLLAAAVSLVATASAGAFSQRGFVFNEAKTFGSTGSGPGQMLNPAGVAVNQVTGDIYVMDAGNNRVDMFNAAHEFQRAWGIGVINGGNEFQICTTVCTKGKPGKKKGQLHGAGSIAVDSDQSSPSFGDVYVEVKPFEEEVGNKETELEGLLIQKYDGATGNVVTTIKGWKPIGKGETLELFEEPFGIAVGEQGQLFVYNEEEEIYELNNEEKNKFVRIYEYEASGRAAGGLAAAADNTFYIAHAETEDEEAVEPPKQFGKYVLGFEHEPGESQEEAKEEGGAEVLLSIDEAIVREPSAGVAVSPNNQDVLVDTGTNVVIVDPAGETVQRLGAGSESGALEKSTGVAANNKSKEVLAADAGMNRIAVFAAETPGKPKIEETGNSNATATHLDLTASIAPGGQATTYWFRYSPEAVPPASQPCSSPCVEVPLPHATLAEGAEEDFANVAAAPIEVTGLTPRTLYHFIAFASNASGTVEGPEQKVTTPAPALGEALPDGRRWELVSPDKGKNGATVEGPTREGGLIQAAADGHALTYVTSTAFDGAEGNRAPEPNQILAVRHDAGSTSQWANRDINTPNGEPTGIAAGTPTEYQWFTADLSEAVVLPRSEILLSPEASEVTAYKRSNFGSCEEAVTSSCYRAIANDTNVTGEREVEGKKEKVPYGGDLEPVPYMTPNGEHVVLEGKEFPLTSENTASRGLYEWTAATGQLKVINVLSNGTPLPSPRLGASGPPSSKLVRNAVSADGSRAIFSSGGHLYQRNTATAKTLRVDQPEEGVTETLAQPKYQTASEDGKTIFFTDNARLTKNSTAEVGPVPKPDLYSCEVEEVAGEPKCKLTDLTVNGNASEPADVQGVVPGAAADGSTVFFVANGALSGAAAQGSCSNETEVRDQLEELSLSNVCNLYVRHRTAPGEWGPPKLIATLSLEDEPDWHVGGELDPGLMTSRVSPNGEWMAFMSDRRLPTATNPAGYNNKDANSGKPDEEAFLYNATTNKLVCASCDPTGARPVGVHEALQSGEGLGLLVDRPRIWQARWIAANIPGGIKIGVTTSFYESRALLDNGRLFFNSSQALAPQDENGTKQDVYEYEPAGILGPDGVAQCTTASDTYGEGSLGCVSLLSSGRDHHESAFLDASESGNDVFIDTAAPLAPIDADSSFDVYDAAVCGQPGTESCVPPPAALPPPCVGESCHEGAPESGSTGGGSAGTLADAGSRNSTKHEVLGTTEEKKPTTTKPKVLTRAQKYAKALKACKKIKSKQKRAKCVAQAKKHFGPPAKKAKKGSVKR